MVSSYLSKRDELEKLRGTLDTEYASFRSHHKQLGEFILPTRPRFFVTQSNRGERKTQQIIDSTATQAADTLASGLMGGLSSPATPWLKLTVSDPYLKEDQAVQVWLDDLTEKLLEIYAKSNIYDSFREMYKDAAVFGTSCVLIEEDYDSVLHSYTLPIGSYFLGLGKKNKVEVLFREFRMTVRQLVMTFGGEEAEPDWSKFSTKVKALWDQKEREQWIDVCHVIKPNAEHDAQRLESKYKKFSSCYYERGTQSKNASGYSVEDDRYLRESGYDYFPVLCFRWEVSGEDIWATNCPGMTALGDIKALQHLWKKYAVAVDKSHAPPLLATAGLRNHRVSSMADDITWVDLSTGGKIAEQVAPMYAVRPDTMGLEKTIDAHQFRIQQAFFVDVILSLINPAVDAKRDMTAREVDERHDEKYLKFGSVIIRTHQDVHAPGVEIALDFMAAQGYFDDNPPPEQLRGQDIRVEFISAMAQSQKLVSLGGIDRLAQFVTAISTAVAADTMGVWKKIKVDEMIDEYGKRGGAPAKIIRSDEEYAEIMQADAEIKAKTAQTEMISQGAKAAKDLGTTPMDQGETALTKIADAMKGQAA